MRIGIVAMAAILALVGAGGARGEIRELKIPIEAEQAGKQALGDDPLVTIEPERYKALVAALRKAQADGEKPQPPAAFGALDAQYVGEADAAAGRARFK